MTSPAPESSTRQLNSNNRWECGDAYVVCECGGWNSEVWQKQNRCYFKHARPLFLVDAPAPASCSEVVERLADCVELATETWTDRDYAVLNRAKAEKILHEWREQIRKGANHD